MFKIKIYLKFVNFFSRFRLSRNCMCVATILSQSLSKNLFMDRRYQTLTLSQIPIVIITKNLLWFLIWQRCLVTSCGTILTTTIQCCRFLFLQLYYPNPYLNRIGTKVLKSSLLWLSRLPVIHRDTGMIPAVIVIF